MYIEGQGVELALVIGHGGVGEAVEFRELVDIIPNGAVIGVENMGTVDVDVDALDLLGVDIAGDVGPLVDDQDLFAGLQSLPGADRAVKTRADDQIIILRHKCAPYYI